MGWEDLDFKKHLQKQEAIEDEYKKMVLDVFGTERGKQLLQFLIERFLQKEVASPAEHSNIAFWREGQNSLVRSFMKIIYQKIQE